MNVWKWKIQNIVQVYLLLNTDIDPPLSSRLNLLIFMKEEKYLKKKCYTRREKENEFMQKYFLFALNFGERKTTNKYLRIHFIRQNISTTDFPICLIFFLYFSVVLCAFRLRFTCTLCMYRKQTHVHIYNLHLPYMQRML